MPSGEEPEPISCKRIFREQFPYYIHLGMTYKEYWQMDCTLVKDYRRAYEYRQEYDNSLLWLQGLYVYKAMESQRPGWVFYGKKAPKPELYLDKPLAVTEELRKQYAAEKTRMMAEQIKSTFSKHNQNLDVKKPEEGGKNEH